MLHNKSHCLASSCVSAFARRWQSFDASCPKTNLQFLGPVSHQPLALAMCSKMDTKKRTADSQHGGRGLKGGASATPEYDVFISYSLTDKPLADGLCCCLSTLKVSQQIDGFSEDRSLQVFCEKVGPDKTSFKSLAHALCNSLVAVLVISEQTLKGGAVLDRSSWTQCQDMLLVYEMALELLEIDRLKCLVPLFVGTQVVSAALPGIVLSSIKSSALQLLKGEGLCALPEGQLPRTHVPSLSTGRTPEQTYSAICGLKSLRVQQDVKASVEKAASKIHGVIQRGCAQLTMKRQRQVEGQSTLSNTVAATATATAIVPPTLTTAPEAAASKTALQAPAPTPASAPTTTSISAPTSTPTEMVSPPLSAAVPGRPTAPAKAPVPKPMPPKVTAEASTSESAPAKAPAPKPPMTVAAEGVLWNASVCYRGGGVRSGNISLCLFCSRLTVTATCRHGGRSRCRNRYRNRCNK